jgi:hypothetical protein
MQKTVTVGMGYAAFGEGYQNASQPELRACSEAVEVNSQAGSEIHMFELAFFPAELMSNAMEKRSVLARG